MRELNKGHLLWVAGFCLVFLITRLLGLSSDNINPDAVNWHYRSQQFIVGLKQFDFEKTYQHYHPGVTLMWLTGVPIELYKQVTGIQHYDHVNFAQFHLVAKLSLVAAQLVLSLLILWRLSLIVGFPKAFAALAVFSLEPFVLGNSRLYHMDILFTLLTLLGLLFLFSALKTKSIVEWGVAGLFCALSFLTRSIGVGLFLYAVGLCALVGLLRQDKGAVRSLLVLVASFVLFVFLLFPALWVRPVHYLGEIFREGERIGVRNGHSQIFFGKTTMDPGFWFYPVVLLLKLSPLVLLGCLYELLVVAGQGLREGSLRARLGQSKFTFFNAFLVIFYGVYFVVMSFPTKKIDRYMLFVFPLFAYSGALGLRNFHNNLPKLGFGSTRNKLVLGVLVFLVLGPLVSFYPHYFTYTNPIFGSPEVANEIVGQKPFGVGIFDLRDHLVAMYGKPTSLEAKIPYVLPEIGMIDTKPIKAIYPNSLVSDIRVNGVSDYDLLILGINEEFPDKVVTSDQAFELNSVIRLNGLEYWRVYAKKDN